MGGYQSSFLILGLRKYGCLLVNYYFKVHCYLIQVFYSLSKHTVSACAALQQGFCLSCHIISFSLLCPFSIHTSLVDSSFLLSSPETAFSCDGVS